ncbi:unnamed protein product, partial [Rotaria magnacalcarata]
KQLKVKDKDGAALTDQCHISGGMGDETT